MKMGKATSASGDFRLAGREAATVNALREADLEAIRPPSDYGDSLPALHRYISGPHFRDYYLLLDEQADHIFTMRLAAHAREARGICHIGGAAASARLLEIWTDDAGKLVWYVFEVGCRGGAATHKGMS